MHSRWVYPKKKGLLGGSTFLHPLKRTLKNFVIERFHSLDIKRSFVRDYLLTNAAPSSVFCRIISVACARMYHVAWTPGEVGVSWKFRLFWHFHHIEMIEKAEKLIETVYGRKEFVLVAQVALAKLPS